MDDPICIPHFTMIFKNYWRATAYPAEINIHRPLKVLVHIAYPPRAQIAVYWAVLLYLFGGQEPWPIWPPAAPVIILRSDENHSYPAAQDLDKNRVPSSIFQPSLLSNTKE